MKNTFSDQQLEHIVEQGMIYMCACPAQVAGAMQQLRVLHDYQARCLVEPHNDPRVHQAIADGVLRAHKVLEATLIEVIDLEHWDRETLTMPEGLRRRQLREAQGNP